MGNTIDHIRLNNSFYNPVNNWKHNATPTREDKENIDHKGRKGFGDAVTAEDIFDNPTEEDKKIFNKTWAKEATNSETVAIEKFEHLLNKGLSEEQAFEVIQQSIKNQQRAKNWAEENEKKCKLASDAMTASIACGIASNVLDSESIPSVIRHGVNLAQGIAQGTRAYNQYSVYNRPDDDASLNRFEADYYGNNLSASLANDTTFMETKVKSWGMAVTAFLPEPFRTSVRQLITLPNSLWWRARMLNHINQEFGTDILRYLIHKPLSWLGSKKSIEILEGIKKRNNLEGAYFMQRHYENAGITKKKDQNIGNLVSTTLSNAQDIFSDDLRKKKEASTKLNRTIAPALGAYGMAAVTTGAVASPILKALKIESKIPDFLYSSGVTSQQAIYLPRFVTPLQADTEFLRRELENKEITKHWTKEQLRDRKDLYKKQRNLSYLGTSCLLVSALNTSLKLLKTENQFLSRSIKWIDGLSEDLIAKFFSHRRYLMGYQFRVENPEFYEG